MEHITTTDFHSLYFFAQQVLFKNIHNRPKIRLHIHRRISQLTTHFRDCFRVIINLRLRKLQPMRSTHHNSPISSLNHTTIPKLNQSRQRNTSMRTNKHPRCIRLRHRIHQFLFSSLLNNPIRILERVHCSIYRNRITNLDSGCKSRFRLHRTKILPPGLKM
ncbi:hypothetical protein Hanom_Chr02g00095511 [Helianthus anomalus]